MDARAGAAQDADRAAAASRYSADPFDLAAHRIVAWETSGEHWVVLSDDAAVLQGTDGVRSRAAVVRIVEVTIGGEKGHQIDIYAEGDVRITGQDRAPAPSFRTSVRTAREVRLNPYRPAGLQVVKGPPRGLAILDRCGFAGGVQSRPAAAATPASVAPRQDRQVQRAAAQADPPQSASRAVPAPEPLPPPAAEVVETQATGAAPGSGTRPSAAPDPAAEPDAAMAEPAQPPPASEPDVDLPPIEGSQEFEVPDLNKPDGRVPQVQPLPGPSGDEPAPSIRGESSPRNPRAAAPPTAPILPGTERVITIVPRSNRPLLDHREVTPDGTEVVTVRGGVNIVGRTPKHGIIDAEADNLVIWRHPDPKKKGEQRIGPNGEVIENANDPLEVYLQGNVVIRMDEQKVAGKGDQRTFRAEEAFYNFLTDRLVVNKGEADVFAQGLIAPLKIKAPRIDQFHKIVRRPDGTLVEDTNPEIRAERTVMTGSRFPNPSYQLNNRTVDLTRTSQPLTDPNSGRRLTDPNDPNAPEDLVWQYDARQNVFWMGWVPIFYWPRLKGTADDLETPLRNFGFRSNNYFGQQVLTDWNGFKVFGLQRPQWIDNWNLDLDYLSARTKDFPALGSELGWFGNDLINDLTDPYHRIKAPGEHITKDYFGYLDIWGLKDSGNDVLGSGPAVVTNGPPGAGQRGYQRDDVPPFQDFRGRFNARHMQHFLPDDDEHHFEDLRLQLEIAYVSDRHFLEEYYKRLSEVGLDQETLGYMQYQKNNTAWSLWGEANLQDFYTDTQWLPRLDYYRLGDSLLDHWFNYSQHSGADYANTHTDVMVNNPNLFAFMPYDPISNTSGPFSAFRAYTNHEIDMPLNIYDVVRVMPYLQGQAVGWSDQIGGGPFNQQDTGALGRIWGAAGVHTEMSAWKVYPWAEDEILNIHGLNNKISLSADFRTAYANQNLDQIAVQDDLDDNTYEFVRRYFAMTSWTGGILPGMYDPRHLMLRRTISPITGTTDVQGSMTTLQLGWHQRLQTKRGPEGKRRIVDWMTLDVNGTYFPNAQRDNFGTPWGQTTYNYQWFLGDRTSIVSSGWFDFWPISGSKPLDNYNVQGFNPQGLNIITTGISLSRPPRASVYIGYTVINTGVINTSALNTSLSYWLSPKWYGSFSTSYDFGNKILLGSMFSLTRIGADYLTSVGLNVDPQRQSYMFAVQISPRLSPNMRLGAGVGLNQLDSRYAPTQ
ncbi:LPS-assembly protein LptD [Aquisphaera giovannonii]|uniref:hypothetical protein n=1 Tax=Aquisphaera giovannonii TaxID=406548 RepID=UPI001FE7096D|nr:hypothetical protein [Aquisphaera giovannonii]